MYKALLDVQVYMMYRVLALWSKIRLGDNIFVLPGCYPCKTKALIIC